MTSTAWRAEDGRVLEYQTGFRDISEYKKTEEELKGVEKFRILFEFAPDAYYLNDLKGNFVDGNKAAEDLIEKSLLSLKLVSSSHVPKLIAALTRKALGQARANCRRHC
jgi:PAS domain-containing protein